MRLAMAKPVDHAAREARLAAKLRENLHRRKAQARALDGGDRARGEPPSDGSTIPGESDSAALSNSPPES